MRVSDEGRAVWFTSVIQRVSFRGQLISLVGEVVSGVSLDVIGSRALCHIV